MRVLPLLLALLAPALLGACGESGKTAERGPQKAAPAEPAPVPDVLPARPGEAEKIAEARALIAKNDGRGFGDLLSLTLKGMSPMLEAAIDEEFGGPPPEGTNWWTFWEFARAETAALARRKLAAIRWFHDGRVDLPAGELSAADICKRLAKTTGLDWVCLVESGEVRVRLVSTLEPKRFVEECLEPAGLSLRLPEGTFVIGSPERLEEMDTDVFPGARGWPALLRPALERQIDLNIRNRPLADALKEAAAQARLVLLIKPGVVRSDVRVTARLKNIQTADALAFLCRLGNARATLPLGILTIDLAGE